MKSSKKIVIVVIICIVAICIGYKFFINKDNTQQTSNVAVTTNAKDIKTDNKKLEASDNGVKAEPLVAKKENNTTNIDSKSNVDNSANNIKTVSNVNTINARQNVNKPSKEQEGVIRILPAKGGQYTNNSVVILNTTKKEVPVRVLVDVVKNWLVNWQYSYSGFADYKNTVWSQPWVNTLSDSSITGAFVEANGQDSPYYNVTAAELNSAAMQLTKNAIKENPNPLSLAQVTSFVKESLTKDYPNEKIVKIVEKSGCYYVYTDPYNKTNKWPFWVVESATGFTRG